MWPLSQLWILLVSIVFVYCDVIDNGLSGDPIVECAAEGLTVRFKTQKEFEGHVYVKGHYDDPACRKDATLVNGVNLTVPFTSCDVRRQRSSSPKGLFLSVTMIISFHPMFVTKIDKSYNVQCFYTETEKTVTQNLDVNYGRDMERKLLVIVGDSGNETKQIAHGLMRHPSDQADSEGFDGIPEEAITSSVPLPVCRYQVLSETAQGEPVKFATVGQQVYHQWTCEDENTAKDSQFCATVHSCNVREEGGKESQLLDENGCAVDRYLLNNLVYTSPLTGGQTSHVFKYADQNTLFFQCQIRLSLKEDGVCRRSSDNCPSTLRGKRSTDEKKTRTGQEVDVFSQSMTVFEIDDPVSPSAAKDLGESSAQWSSRNVCVTTTTFGLFLSLLASVLLISLITVGLLCCRPHTVKVNLQE